MNQGSGTRFSSSDPAAAVGSEPVVASMAGRWASARVLDSGSLFTAGALLRPSRALYSVLGLILV